MRSPQLGAIGWWVGLQCTALTVVAAGVHLWPHQPEPADALALPVVVGAQILGAALLFPVVLPDPVTVAVNLAIAWAMQQLAGVLTVSSAVTIWGTGAFVSLWVLGLGAWARAARGPLGQAWAQCGALLLTVGGAVVWYVAAEDHAQSASPAPNPARFGILLAGLARSNSISLPWLGWTVVSLPLVTGIGWLACRRWLWTPFRPPLPPTRAENRC